ncbi:hypothetical protein IWZ01DRAFT_541374 [Phyllosticta capitalensis]
MLTLALDMWPAFMTSAPMSMRVVNPPYDNTTTHWISGTEDSPLMLKIHDNRSDPDDSTTWRQYRLIRDTCGAPLVAIRFNTEGKRHKPIFHVTRPDSKVPIFTFRPRIDKKWKDFRADIRINNDTVYMNARDGSAAFIDVVDPHTRVDMLFITTICTLMDLSIMECMAANHLQRLLKWGSARMPRIFRKRESYQGIERDIPKLWQ